MSGAGFDIELVEAIARRVVELLGGEALPPGARYVDAATLARELDVEREWVYANAERLGAIRLGGPKGRLRFDREVVKERLSLPERDGGRRLRPSSRRRPRPTRKRRAPGVKSAQIQRRASGSAPARSPKRHQTGGSPE